MKLSNSKYLPTWQLPKEGMLALNDINEVHAMLDELANLKISRGRQKNREFDRFPVLIVWGEKDYMTDKKGRFLREVTRQPYFTLTVNSSEAQSRILKFNDFFNLKHEFRGLRMKRFGV
jgi:hypothetical protein